MGRMYERGIEVLEGILRRREGREISRREEMSIEVSGGLVRVFLVDVCLFVCCRFRRGWRVF